MSWPNAQAGKGAALVPVAAAGLDQDFEGGRLAFLCPSPSPFQHTVTIFFLLFTSSQNVLPKKELKEEGQFLGLGLCVTLKVWSGQNPCDGKTFVNAGDIVRSLGQKAGPSVGLRGLQHPPF